MLSRLYFLYKQIIQLIIDTVCCFGYNKPVTKSCDTL